MGRAFWEVLAVSAVAFVLSGLFGAGVWIAFEGRVDQDFLKLVAGVGGSSISFLAVALVVVAGRPGGLRLHPARPRYFALAIAGMLSLTTILGVVIDLLGLDDVGTLDFFRQLLGRLGVAERLLLLPLTALAAGTAEELFFRGYALSALEPASGPWAAVAITAALFGLIHFDFVHSPAAALMGLFLGYISVRAQSVWPVIAAHVVNNALATALPDLSPEAFGAKIALLAGSSVAFLLVLQAISSEHRHR